MTQEKLLKPTTSEQDFNESESNKIKISIKSKAIGNRSRNLKQKKRRNKQTCCCFFPAKSFMSSSDSSSSPYHSENGLNCKSYKKKMKYFYL